MTPATNQSTVPFLRVIRLGNVSLNLFYPTSSLQTESLIIRIILFRIHRDKKAENSSLHNIPHLPPKLHLILKGCEGTMINYTRNRNNKNNMLACHSFLLSQGGSKSNLSDHVARGQARSWLAVHQVHELSILDIFPRLSYIYLNILY